MTAPCRVRLARCSGRRDERSVMLRDSIASIIGWLDTARDGWDVAAGVREGPGAEAGAVRLV